MPGALPVDLKKAQVTFAAGGAQKWLMGPTGVGYFYCAQEHLDLLEVTTVGATTVRSIQPYLDYDFQLRKDTNRFEYGTLPNYSIIGMGAAVDLLLEAGAENISQRIYKLTTMLVEGLQEAGFTCHSPRGENEWSGIVSFTHPDVPPQALTDILWKNGIFAREREGYLRLAPHYYLTEEEIEKIIRTLAENV